MFPSGFLVGSVKDFHVRELDGQAQLTPAVDLSHLEDVFVVTGQQMIFFVFLLVFVFDRAGRGIFIPPLRLDLQCAHLYCAGDCFLRCDGAAFPLMLALAIFAGFLLDALTVQVIGRELKSRSGWSILLYAVLAGIMHGLRPLFIRGRWEVH